MISVCLATYNGEKFIGQQLVSILEQLRCFDELILVDDCSLDSTLEIVDSFSDSRLKVYRNDSNAGVNSTFSKAISLSSGQFIFLADQDDVWLPDRVQKMLVSLQQKGVFLVSTNFDFIDGSGKPLINNEFRRLKEGDSGNYILNIIGIFLSRRNYYGCAMAFRSEFKKVILPFPTFLESHDLWIAMAANFFHVNYHLDINTLSRRIHGGNLSVVTRSLHKKIYSRFIYFLNFVQLFVRRKNKINIL